MQSKNADHAKGQIYFIEHILRLRRLGCENAKPMHETRKLLAFVKPYWKRATVALLLLTTLVFLDLSIPRLIQRLIDQGVDQQNQQVVIQTSIVMLAISAVSTLIAVGNNNL